MSSIPLQYTEQSEPTTLVLCKGYSIVVSSGIFNSTPFCLTKKKVISLFFFHETIFNTHYIKTYLLKCAVHVELNLHLLLLTNRINRDFDRKTEAQRGCGKSQRKGGTFGQFELQVVRTLYSIIVEQKRLY